MSESIPAYDKCLRCAYDLRGIHNSQPCPECGLLAERSRRVSDEFHDTRPKWLRCLSLGVALILLSIAVCLSWPLVMELQSRSLSTPQMFLIQAERSGMQWLCATFLLFAGGTFLARPEGYPPADHADAKLRLAVRCVSGVPMFALMIWTLNELVFTYASMTRLPNNDWNLAEVFSVIVLTVGSIPLPLLLFHRLRGLAQRAHSAHLAEHCLIVGFGTSLALAYVSVAWVLLYNGNRWFGTHWIARSNAALVITLVLALLAAVFVLWSIYLLIRFVIAFAKAARALKRKWKADDASAVSA